MINVEEFTKDSSLIMALRIIIIYFIGDNCGNIGNTTFILNSKGTVRPAILQYCLSGAH